MPPLEAGLAVSESGDQGGPPLLLLHGIGGLGAMWAPATSHLAEFRCLTPDLPGHGGSRGTAWRSFADSAAAVEALIATQSPDTPVHLAGLSLGGYVALHIAARGRVPLGRVLVSGVPFSPLPRQTLMRVMAYLMLPFIRSERMARANMKAMRITDAASVSAAIAGMKAVGRRSFLRANLDAVAH
ncbi:MAG: alpha/beta fold hydrolase, partial [Pseudomonadota bacterium]